MCSNSADARHERQGCRRTGKRAGWLQPRSSRTYAGERFRFVAHAQRLHGGHPARNRGSWIPACRGWGPGPATTARRHTMRGGMSIEARPREMRLLEGARDATEDGDALGFSELDLVGVEFFTPLPRLGDVRLFARKMTCRSARRSHKRVRDEETPPYRPKRIGYRWCGSRRATSMRTFAAQRSGDPRSHSAGRRAHSGAASVLHAPRTGRHSSAHPRQAWLQPRPREPIQRPRSPATASTVPSA